MAMISWPCFGLLRNRKLLRHPPDHSVGMPHGNNGLTCQLDGQKFMGGFWPGKIMFPHSRAMKK